MPGAGKEECRWMEPKRHFFLADGEGTAVGVDYIISIPLIASANLYIKLTTEDRASRAHHGGYDCYHMRYETLLLVRRRRLATSLVMRSLAVCSVRDGLPLLAAAVAQSHSLTLKDPL